MSGESSRRRFLRQSAAAGAMAGLGDLAFLGKLNPVSAADATPEPQRVRLDSDIEPLVKMLEDTPREKLLETVAERIHKGLNYQDLLAALLLAGVRNVQPRPHVGFKFHAVLVVNSAHLASLASPPEHRWLPIFWALDYFKDAQAQDVREGDWTMSPVNESRVPSATGAKAAFTTAMDQWDEGAADAAAAGLARTAGVNEIFELMFRYGARDLRDIGHKAIFVANSLRTLDCVGHQHTEPVLRSLAYALLQHDGARPDQADEATDRPWRHNLERAKKIRPDWLSGTRDDAAVKELLAALRQGSEDDASEKVVELLNKNIAPQSIWDALFLGAGELLVRKPNIVSLHAVTTTNALRYAWGTSASDDTRRMLLLQNAAFLTMFRQELGSGVKEYHLDEMQPQPAESAAGPGAASAAGPAVNSAGGPAVEEIFAKLSGDRMAAAGQTLAYLNEHPDPQAFIDAARVLIFLKGSNAHDYKFSSAVLEDYRNVSAPWRGKFLASSVFQLRGSKGADNKLVERTRAALG